MSSKITVLSRLLLCVLLIVSIALPAGTLMAGAEGAGTDPETVTLDTTVDYGQTEARTMLDLINDFRTDPTEAWQWNNDDSTKTWFNGEDQPLLEELSYDYDLEEAAMVRAAEIAARFSHTRPDGTSCFTAFPEGYSARGENIAVGSVEFSAEEAFVLLQETNEPYADQGHRRNMLNPNYNVVAVGHCRVNGYDYWVQLFGYTDKETEVTSACDAATPVEIEAAKDSVTYSGAANSFSPPEIDYGTSRSLPTVTASYQLPDRYPSTSAIKVVTPVEWTSSDPTVLIIEDGVMKAVKVGNATISADVEPLVSAGDVPVRLTVSFSVDPISISGSDITLEYTEIEYTGKELKPEVKGLTKDGKELPVSSSDITVSYSDVVQVGTGKVTVTGNGNYTGTASTTFTIKECNHVFTEGVIKAATCTEDGTKFLECTKCDYEKTDVIKAKGHTPGAEPTCTADQKCTVCDEVIKKALGHTPQSGSFDCTADQTCTVCGEAYHKAGSHTPGAEPTCTAEQKCTVCQKVLQQAKGHTPGAAATCTTDQTCTVCKEVLKKATGHTPGAAATCGTPQKCSVCGEVITKATEKHTDTNNDKKCDVCGADTSGKGPITGEMIKSNLPVIIASALVVVSIVVILIVVLRQRKSRSNG